MAKKKPAPKSYRFTAPLEKMNAQMAFMYVEVPIDVEQEFGTKGRLRVLGTVNGVAVDRALMPQKSGVHIIILGGDIRRAAKLKRVGDPVQVEFWKHPSPDELELPEALAETLDFLPEMKAAWDKLTPGMKRNMCYWVGSAKTEATQAKRVAELLRRFEVGYFQVGKGRRKDDA
ncbi:MAG TPA: YdeI/OmpD-associated family protein [Flavobacteriales bacterium]|nr:YdeI/OmpD-associated family protein [Flavobacteriales bacterium]